MKGKLKNKEVLDLVVREFQERDLSIDLSEIIRNVERKIDWIESLSQRSKLAIFIDKNQSSFWFFVALSMILLTAKMLIENALLKHY